ncbi:putative calcium-transporting ATPase 13, plasma membrane-type [Rhodamnia argentea]|uniref:Calcium-transporting ATPase 13, plasma membrane-type n=1 Tax=Rhodamnia argentea TaxID=178133 RepID=A0ABM3H6I5_9MYRT|nr:putative calcium-transporting ATPase 13, plasma membrane-type [Rhodamnia argentea]
MANGIPGHEEDLHRRRMAILKPKLEAHNRNFIHFLRKSCNSSTIFLLLSLDILSFAFRIKEKGLSTGWYEAAVILSAVILIVIVQSICESRNESSRQLSTNQLWQNQEPKVHVLRGGCRQTICISDVLLGDIVLLEKGEQVPADGLLIPTESLEVNDKADPIINDHNPFVFYGSKVTDGTGKMLVTSVGAKTKLGNMLSRARPSKRTPVEEQLRKLSNSTQIIGIVISIIIIVVSFSRFKLKKEYDNSGLRDFSGKSHTLKGLYEAIKRVALRPQGMLTMLTSSLTLLLVGIAEGLPLAITIAITCWNKRMLEGVNSQTRKQYQLTDLEQNPVEGTGKPSAKELQWKAIKVLCFELSFDPTHSLTEHNHYTAEMSRKQKYRHEFGTSTCKRAQLKHQSVS